MNIFNFGSLNIDYIYQVENFARAGETISSLGMEAFPGGKGLNQSVAAGKAGGKVYHVGSVGEDGTILFSELCEAGVDLTYTKISKTRTGHAVIQVNKRGQNSIIIAHGANFAMTETHVDEALTKACPGDIALMQNEINGIPEIMRKAKYRQMKVVFNPSPITPELIKYPLDLVDTFILNEIEGSFLSGKQTPDEILEVLGGFYPEAEFILTLGEEGSRYQKHKTCYTIPAIKAEAVDTTGAGDTFCGYYIASIANQMDILTALHRAAAAAAIAVTRPGASTAVPSAREVERLMGGDAETQA